jgi:hypothetical protein
MTHQDLFRTRVFGHACVLAVATLAALLPAAAGAAPQRALDTTNGLPASPAVSSVLPGGRSVEVGTTATVFATMINAGPTALTGCQIGLPASAPSGLSISYQTTDPATNQPTGTPNTPVTIAGNDGIQTFLLAFSATAPLAAPGLALSFVCTGVQPVTTIPGVNTVDLLFSASPIPDVVALAATATNNGVVDVPFSNSGAGAFAVASDNVGADGMITVTADTGSATLPLTITLCETTSNGQCLAAPASSVTLDYMAGATPTFSVFIAASGPVAFAPANSRIFLRFLDGSGVSHGSTSVAVETD